MLTKKSQVVLNQLSGKQLAEFPFLSNFPDNNILTHNTNYNIILCFATLLFAMFVSSDV